MWYNRGRIGEEETKKKILSIIFAVLIIFGGVASWKYSGADAAVKAQNEIMEKGLYYNGDAWMSSEAFNALKLSLSTRNSSIRTSNDLEILPESNSNGELHVKYNFFSVEVYSGLNGTADFPPSFELGLSVASTILPVLFFAFPLIWAFFVLMRGTVKTVKG